MIVVVVAVIAVVFVKKKLGPKKFWVKENKSKQAGAELCQAHHSLS